ncbi:MAG: uroporphyrinogen decarboxylase family protein [Capsulimonadaceae bacterium]|nr:uroporphyrinogen decarboxylase family protein [Capsulimonadaceae bacterium]
MSHASLTGRERVSRMFARQDHDRVPRHDTFWSDTILRWQIEGLSGGQEAALELLDSDFRPLCWSLPVPFPGMNDILSEDESSQTVRDAFGNISRKWKNKETEPELLRFGCVDRDDWDQTYKPLMVTAGLHVDVKGARNAFAEAHRRGQWSFFSASETFEMTRQMLGEETTLVAMASEPDFIRDVSNIYTDLILRDFEALYEDGIRPDGIWLFGDMAYNYGPMCSPAMYRDLIWPDHVRMAHWAHARNLPVIYHSDGNVSAYLDLYIEAGFDCIHPLENCASLHLQDIGPRYGKSLCLFGNIDVSILGSNDPVRIEQEISSKLAAGKRTRAYAYHSDHSVPASVSWETYKLVIKLLDHYGYYD